MRLDQQLKKSSKRIEYENKIKLLEKLVVEEEKKFQNDIDTLLNYTEHINTIKEKYNENHYKISIFCSKRVLKTIDKSYIDYEIISEYRKKMCQIKMILPEPICFKDEILLSDYNFNIIIVWIRIIMEYLIISPLNDKSIYSLTETEIIQLINYITFNTKTPIRDDYLETLQLIIDL